MKSLNRLTWKRRCFKHDRFQVIIGFELETVWRPWTYPLIGGIIILIAAQSSLQEKYRVGPTTVSKFIADFIATTVRHTTGESSAKTSQGTLKLWLLRWITCYLIPPNLYPTKQQIHKGTMRDTFLSLKYQTCSVCSPSCFVFSRSSTVYWCQQLRPLETGSNSKIEETPVVVCVVCRNMTPYNMLYAQYYGISIDTVWMCMDWV